MHIGALHFYPVKSCRGIALREASFDARGIVDDRSFLVVDADNGFVTQRSRPRMALIGAALARGTLTLTAPGREPLTVGIAHAGVRRRVTIWRDTAEAVDQGDAAADWLSGWLNEPVRLVRMADDWARLVSGDYAVRPTDQTGFADGYPALLIGEASLAALNARLAGKGAPALPMNRFRPNIVVAGAPPFAEDGWKRIRAGGMIFDLVKPCARCEVTTTDQDTAERGKEPLITLAEFRRIDGKVMFGQNVIHAGPGALRVGDRVEILA